MGFSARSFRGSTRATRRRFSGLSARYTGVTRVSSSTSQPKWLYDQRQELLAARDVEAMRLLIEDGDVEQFVKHGLERIAANVPEQADRDRWTALFLGAVGKAEQTMAQQAQQRQMTQWSIEDRQRRVTRDAITAEINGMSADLEAGELAGVEYLWYLSKTMAKYKAGSEERSLYAQAYAEAKKWIEVTNRAMEKRLDMEISAAVANKEMTLEAALRSYEDRRAKVQPGDEAYAQLTNQIAQVKNAIEAEQTNSLLQNAYAKMIDNPDQAAGRREYLSTLVGLMNRARTAEAQKSLFDQIGKLREAITRDETIKAAQETNDLLVRYYDPTKKVNATEVYQFLAKKALEARSEQEGARYENLAQQVAAHERQKAQDALAAARRGSGGAGGPGSGGAGGPGFTTEQVNVALGPFEDAYKDARQVIDQKIDRGLTPTQTDWAILKQTRDRYLDVIGQAFTQGNAAAKRSVSNTERTVRKESGAGDEFEFGDLGEKMSSKIVSDTKAMWAPLARQVGDEGSKPKAGEDTALVMRALSRFTFDVRDAMASPFLNEKGREDLLELQTRTIEKIQGRVGDAVNTILGEKSGLAIGRLSEMYDKYVDSFKERYRDREPLDFNAWMDAMSGAETSRDASSATAGLGVNVTPGELRSFRGLLEQDDIEQRDAVDRLVEATAIRKRDGTIDPNWLPGGRLDEGTRALFRQGVVDGMSLLPLGGGIPADDGAPQFGVPFGVRGRPEALMGGGPASRTTQNQLNMFVQPEEWGSMAPPAQVPGLVGPAGYTSSAGPAGVSDTTGEADPFAQWQSVLSSIGTNTPQYGDEGFYDESARLARRARFDADPYGTAWDYLVADVEMAWPTIVVPEMPPQSPFYSPDGRRAGEASPFRPEPEISYDIEWPTFAPGGPSFDPGAPSAPSVPVDADSAWPSVPSYGGGGPTLVE